MRFESVKSLVLHKASRQGFVPAVEEDGTVSLYPQGAYKEKLIWRIVPCGEGVQFIVQDPKDCTNWEGFLARNMREAVDLTEQYIDYYGGGKR